jgi:oligosaccharide repeat unit polymerase
MITLLCCLVTAAVVVSWLRKGADPLSPGRLFLVVWAVAIGLTELKLSDLQHSWSLEGWFVLLVAVAAFLTAAFTMYVIHLDSPLYSLPSMREKMKQEHLRGRPLFLGIVAMFLSYAISYGVIYFVKGFLPIFSLQTALLRTEFQLFFFGIFLHMVVPILFFCAIFMVKVPSETVRKVLLVVVALVTFTSYILLLSRYQLIMGLTITVVFLYYATTKIRLWTVLAFLSAAVLVSAVILSFRTGELFQLFLWKTSKMHVPKEFAFVTEPYMYVVMNLENFVRGVERLEQHTLGLMSADFLLALSGLKHPIREYLQIENLPYLVSGYNTYTSFWTYYRDFGVGGLVAVQFALGIIAASLYYRMRLAPSLGKIIAYAICVFVIMLSFFINILSNLWFVSICFGMYVLFRIAQHKTTR